MNTQEMLLNALKSNLKTWTPQIIDFVGSLVQQKTSPELDRWIRVGCSAVKAGLDQMYKEFNID